MQGTICTTEMPNH